jgi:hypothetical protein
MEYTVESLIFAGLLIRDGKPFQIMYCAFSRCRGLRESKTHAKKSNFTVLDKAAEMYKSMS